MASANAPLWFDASVIGWHMPVEHVPPKQSCPHLPQFFGSFARSTSQPVDGSLSQSKNVLRHVSTHAPDLHCAMVWSLLHTLPHPPQFCGSPWTFAQYGVLPVQSVYPS